MIEGALTLTGFLAWLGAAFILGTWFGLWWAVPTLFASDEDDPARHEPDEIVDRVDARD